MFGLFVVDPEGGIIGETNGTLAGSGGDFGAEKNIGG